MQAFAFEPTELHALRGANGCASTKPSGQNCNVSKHKPGLKKTLDDRSVGFQQTQEVKAETENHITSRIRDTSTVESRKHKYISAALPKFDAANERHVNAHCHGPNLPAAQHAKHYLRRQHATLSARKY